MFQHLKILSLFLFNSEKENSLSSKMGRFSPKVEMLTGILGEEGYHILEAIQKL